MNTSQIFNKRMPFVFCALLAIYNIPLTQAGPLPDGVTLPEGVELPDNFSLPAGIKIPEGFEITEDMIQQYLKYLEDNESDNKDTLAGDQWFKQLAEDHPNANL